MKLSVVIATFNRAECLKQSLDEFCKQTDMDFEVVVAMDGCTDNTEEILKECKKKAPFELKWVNTGETDRYCLGKARNIGILETAGEAVVIVDDDSFPVPEFVKEHKRTVRRKTLTGGYRNSHDPNDELHAKMEKLIKGNMKLPGEVVENNCCMYRKNWIECGLFSERIEGYGGVGQEFLRRLRDQGYKYQFNPEAMIYHHREFENMYGLTRPKKTIEFLRKQLALDNYKADRALIAAPFGQEHFDECIGHLKDSKAVAELARKGEILALVITSIDTTIGNYPEWLKIIQIDKIPNWPTEDAYQNRFIKWAIPFLFKNIRCSIYIDSDLIITDNPEKLRHVFDTTEKHSFFVSRHVIRKGWQDEFNAILRWKYLDSNKLQKQKELFKKMDMPIKGPVFENNFVGRVHGSKYDVLSEEVLNQLSEYSERDQLALVYAMFKSKITPFSLSEGQILFAGHVNSVNSDSISFVDHFHRDKFHSICKSIDKKTVAVVIPAYNEDLTPDEEISLRHLKHHLGEYDKYFVMPSDMKLRIKHNGFFIRQFDKRYFGSTEKYSNLLVSKEFYEAFADYEYILIYQLDALVFSDRLLLWCKKGYDYIGAPWYKIEVKRLENWEPEQDCVGNGGFSLRKTQSFINVLNNYNNPLRKAKNRINGYLSLFLYYISRTPKKLWDYITRKQSMSSMLKSGSKRLKDVDYKNREDAFWSFKAKKYYPEFKIASAQEAVAFSFEVSPRFCFEKNGRKLPFGCHAWAKWDRKFWEGHLLKQAAHINNPPVINPS